MADLRPFRALRYRSEAIGDLGSVLAPPFDVIEPEEQASLHQLSPCNIVRLELSEGRADDSPEENRYTRAAATMQSWRESGVLQQEERPAFYRYVQRFDQGGRTYGRTALFARLRLEPWESGAIRPHEETVSSPKEDRLQLLRHLRTNISSLLVLYRDPTRSIEAHLKETGPPLVDAVTPDGQRHELSELTDAAVIDAISTALRETTLYMADGHHRYETALAYREERRSQAEAWTGEEPENFVLVALTAVEDPGLLLLPIHRLVRPRAVPSDLVSRLERYFDIEDISPKSYDGTALLRLLARLNATRGAAFGALGLEEGRLHLLTLKDATSARALMPAHSAAWQALDANVLEYAVLREALGLRSADTEAVKYTEDADFAMREVESGRWPLAFLTKKLPVEQVLAVADAGEKMPRKSTFFSPKLATGLVLHAFD